MGMRDEKEGKRRKEEGHEGRRGGGEERRRREEVISKIPLINMWAVLTRVTATTNSLVN